MSMTIAVEHERGRVIVMYRGIYEDTAEYLCKQTNNWSWTIAQLFKNSDEGGKLGLPINGRVKLDRTRNMIQFWKPFSLSLLASVLRILN